MRIFSEGVSLWVAEAKEAQKTTLWLQFRVDFSPELMQNFPRWCCPARKTAMAASCSAKSSPLIAFRRCNSTKNTGCKTSKAKPSQLIRQWKSTLPLKDMRARLSAALSQVECSETGDKASAALCSSVSRSDRRKWRSWPLRFILLTLWPKSFRFERNWVLLRFAKSLLRIV